MVATPAMIAQISEFSVSDTGNAIFTTSIFNTLSPVAQALLDEDNPGLPDALYDYCHALLIAHLYSVKKGLTGYQSQTAQGYSVQRRVGQTAYMVEYQKTIKHWAAKIRPSVGSISNEYSSRRADSRMDGLQLDEAEIPSFFEGL